MEFNTITLDQDGSIAYLTLNRPSVRNAINSQMIAELHQAAMLLDNQPINIVVFQGTGASFCSGVDITEKASMGQKTEEEQILHAETFVDMFYRLSSMKSILVGIAHGHSVGGGLGLLAACDIVVAEPTARFSVTATKIGILPAAMSTVLAQALGVRWAKYLSLSGQMIDAQMATMAGLVHMIAQDAGGAGLQSILRLLGDGHQPAILATKRLYNRFQIDYHSSTRSERLAMVRGYATAQPAQERFERYEREGVFWHRT